MQEKICCASYTHRANIDQPASVDKQKNIVDLVNCYLHHTHHKYCSINIINTVIIIKVVTIKK